MRALPATTLLRRTFCRTDAFVFVFITGCAASAATLGISNPFTLAIFAITWVCGAIERVIAFRKGVRPAVRLERGNAYAVAVMVAGMGPWMAMHPAHVLFPSLAIWTPVHVSSGLYAVGLVLAAASIAEPLIFRGRNVTERVDGFSWQLYREGLLRSAAVLLLSGSLVIAALCALWLTLTLWWTSEPFRCGRSVRLQADPATSG